MELFVERGFGDVTINEIAERADVDPSTFFRHFRSKEMVLFTDITDVVGHIRDALLSQPADVDLLEALRRCGAQLAAALPFDPALERLRRQMGERTSALEAQAQLYREVVVRELERAIAERQGVDLLEDPRPYLAASTFVAGFVWFRRSVLLSDRAPVDVEGAVDEVAALLAPTWRYFAAGAG
jgi:AcrR family transcriptional regulator